MSLYPESSYVRLSLGKSRQVVLSGMTDFSFATDESTAVETHDFFQEELSCVVADILGWSKKSGIKIYRKIPARHSSYPYMFANKIARVDHLGPSGQFLSGLGYDARYKQLRLTINYAIPPYLIAGAANGFGNVPDPFNDTEDRRYLQPIDYQISSEFVQQKMHMFNWPTGSDAPQQGKPIPESAGRSILVTKTKLSFLWVQIPDDGLFMGAGGAAGFENTKTSPKIQGCIGKVNDKTFLGFDRGTVLFEGWKPIPRVSPVPSSYLGLPPLTTPRFWDVQLVFSYFDPTPVGQHAANAAGEPKGHNLVPTPQGKWYRILANDPAVDLSANWKYQESDFNKIFEMN